MKLYRANCLDILPALEENSIDTIITDPPGGIAFMGKSWDDLSNHGAKTERGRAIEPLLSSMVELGMLEKWAAGFLLFTVDWAGEALRVAKPGATSLTWAIPRTSDLTKFGLRLAGWDVKDTIYHIFGTGFPKSHDISKAIDKMEDAKRDVVGTARGHTGNRVESHSGVHDDDNYEWPGEYNITAPATDAAQLWDGYGTALKPAAEEWILCYKPYEKTYANNALTWGVAGLWVDGGRVATEGPRTMKTGRSNPEGGRVQSTDYGEFEAWDGEYKVEPRGRWPTNLILDEAAGELLDEQTGTLRNGGQNATSVKGDGMFMDGDMERGTTRFAGDSGGASRFFYCAKASRSERNLGCEDLYWMRTKDGHKRVPKAVWDNLPKKKRTEGNIHPTVKPLSLMEYLCKLTRTPTGGVVLDPFMGSGSTGVACIRTKRDFIGIEMEEVSYIISECRTGAER